MEKEQSVDEQNAIAELPTGSDTLQPRKGGQRELSADAGVPAQRETAKPAEVAGLQDKLATLRDRYLRLAADFDNFRKRIQRENEHRAAAQKEAFVRDLLPVIDNLERCLSNTVGSSSEDLKPGVQMIFQQALQVLKQHGFESQEDRGQPFNPSFHEALAVRTDATCPDHTVLEVWQRGWRRGGALFRPAKVLVNDLAANASLETWQNPKP